MGFGEKKQLVGVDIGSFAIKVVEIEQTKKVPRQTTGVEGLI